MRFGRPSTGQPTASQLIRVQGPAGLRRLRQRARLAPAAGAAADAQGAEPRALHQARPAALRVAADAQGEQRAAAAGAAGRLSR